MFDRETEQENCSAGTELRENVTPGIIYTHEYGICILPAQGVKLDDHSKIWMCGFCSSDYGGDRHKIHEETTLLVAQAQAAVLPAVGTMSSLPQQGSSMLLVSEYTGPGSPRHLS